MRFKVPQNIDMPDRVLGPLTLVQFVYAVIGFGAAYVTYNSLPSPLGILAAIPIAILTFCIIFVKINERPFTQFIMSFINFVAKPKVRTWQKSYSLDDYSVEIYKPVTKDSNVAVHKDLDHDTIENLARQLDYDIAKVKQK